MSDESFSGTTVLGAFGESFGRYELRDRLGSGGFAEVYRAYDPELSREVALKVILPHIAADSDFVDRFLQEMRFAAGLNHPAIVPIYDVGRSSSGRPFFTMALLAGENLAARLRGGSPATPDEALRILAPVGSALDYLAEGGLVHRDLKPANIIVGPRGGVTLIDFGIARVAASATHLTQTGALVGTPAYMAPEQILGREIGPAADRYALGVVAYELLSGKPPFGGDTAQILYRQVHEPPAPLDHVRPPLPEPVSRAVTWALTKDPAQRPPSAAVFLAAFQNDRDAARFQERVTEPLARRDRQVVHPDAQRSRRPLIAAAGVLVALVAIAALLLVRHGGRGKTPSGLPAVAATAAPATAAALAGGQTATPSAGRSVPAAVTAAPVLTPTPAAVTTRIPAVAPTQTPPAVLTPPEGSATEPGSTTGTPRSVVVTERFGAALRLTPSSDAAVYVVASCGEQLPIVTVGNGWYQVHTPARDLWVGGARVADAANPPVYDCRDAVTFQVNDQVLTSVASGCLSLRSAPSTSADYVYCVDNGHRYIILNGPLAADGEDWFQVTSASTGSGWVIARFLLPAR